jgi:type IV pilus assembly protein PilO
MNLDLDELDLVNVARWPFAARLVVILFLMASVVFLGYWFHIKEQLGNLEFAEDEEETLKVTFENKARQAANLEAYEDQLAEMRESFGAMLRQLPDQTEIADLLVDVSQTGLASGLEFELFQPRSENPKDFYAEKPISISVVGNYHEFGGFVSGVAALPRIVTLHDIQISRKNKAGQLGMSLTAKTYRYIADDEVTDEENN